MSSLPPLQPSSAAAHAALKAALVKAFAARQSQAIARRTGAGIAQRLRSGLDVVGTPPFGFTRDPDGRRVVEPGQWEVVRWLFAHAPQAASLAQLQRDLAAREPDPVKLSARTIARILRKRIYVDGRWTARYRDREFEMPPVKLEEPISPATFSEVQALLHGRRRLPKAQPLTHLPPHAGLLLSPPPPHGWPRHRKTRP